MKLNNKKYGFTVAEVLITISIIGVLTLVVTSIFKTNNSNSWTKSKDYKLGIVKYDKVHNAINQSITQQLMKNNDTSNLGNILNNALNTLNSTCTGSSCNIPNVSNSKSGYNRNVNLSYNLADGSFLAVYSKTDGGITDYIIYVDTNGKSKPNKINQDILPIYVDGAGNVINVNPKTGQKFDKLAQKKYDSSKVFSFKCPFEDKTIFLRKNSETGLYESVNSEDIPEKCSKICKINYAEKVYANYLKNTLSLLSIPIISNNSNVFSYGTEANDIIYSADYNQFTCFTVKPNQCTLTGGKNYFKKYFENAPYNLTVNVNNINSSGNPLSYTTNGIKYSANYDEHDCNIDSNSVTKKCTREGAVAAFKSTSGWGSTVSICSPTVDETNHKVSCKIGHVEYSINYDAQTCTPTKNPQYCSLSDAKEQFASEVGTTVANIETTSTGFKYKSSSAEYIANYDSTNCIGSINEVSTKYRFKVSVVSGHGCDTSNCSLIRKYRPLGSIADWHIYEFYCETSNITTYNCFKTRAPNNLYLY